MRKFFLILAFFLSFGQIVFASAIFTSDINGTLKTQFYPNETVYLAPSTINITTNSTIASVYVMYDSNTWVNQTNLIDVTGSGYKNFTTNSTGWLNNTNAIWASSQRTGNYDVVVDVNQNGIYDQGIDFVFEASTTGFQIVALPTPSLTVGLGENSTGNHNFTVPSSNNDNVMMQVKMTAGDFEDVKIKSLSLIANGTGDDSKGISAIKIILDSNSDGQYNPTETLIGSGKYLRDNGIAQVNIYDGYNIPLNNTAYFLIVYTMSNSSSNGDSYYFNLVSVEVIGVTDMLAAKVSGTPIKSAIKTISAATITTTTSSVITTTAAAQNVTNETTTSTTTTGQSLPKYFWIYIAVGVSVTVIIFFLVFWLRTTHGVQNEYKPPQ